MHREVFLRDTPRRLVSLVPSITAYLYDLVPSSHIVGTTFFCIHPEPLVKDSTRIGGTKKLKLDTIAALSPDLIIGSKEENVEEQVAALATEFPVWMSDVKNLEESLAMMRALGEILKEESKAEAICHNIERSFSALGSVNRTALYLIWRKPFMGAGNDTFIHDIMQHIGLDNVLQAPRYPELSIEEIKDLKPEYILLSSEPYPFREKHLEEMRAVLPESKLMLVDGEMFSWYGSRMQLAPNYFMEVFGI